MIKKWFFGLFLLCFLVSFSFAQKTKKQDQSSWEYLEISVIDDSCGSSPSPCRHYSYFNSGLRANGPVSLDWLNNSGWEFADATSNGGSLNGLLFRRIFNKERTEKEIEWLPKELGKETASKNADLLVDLDKIEDSNQAEEAKLRTALEQIKDLPLKIISISSDNLDNRRTGVGAEIILDGTSVLLKDGNKYRASDADKYFKEIGKQILDKIGALGAAWSDGNAVAISGGGFNPQIGNFLIVKEGISLKISIIVNYRNRQIIVAQGWIYSRWKTNSQ